MKRELQNKSLDWSLYMDHSVHGPRTLAAHLGHLQGLGTGKGGLSMCSRQDWVPLFLVADTLRSTQRRVLWGLLRGSTHRRTSGQLPLTPLGSRPFQSHMILLLSGGLGSVTGALWAWCPGLQAGDACICRLVPGIRILYSHSLSYWLLSFMSGPVLPPQEVFPKHCLQGPSQPQHYLLLS